MTPERRAILATYSGWTALSALRSGAPLKSREDIYPLIAQIDFSPILDTTKGPITKESFEQWHKGALDKLVSATPKLKDQYGWAAKIINVYLKTYCYVGEGGREGIRSVLHPPIDSGLWSGVGRKFKNKNKILADSHIVTKIKDISTHAKYLQIIKGLKAASDELGCTLIEIEQLWEGAGDA
ncbi:hypothetical protein [Methylobacillus sp.]|uniref:hypothetical protein n=1 Tax=Methylobacillus sp. TaxID=56818 RepID=UPI002FE38F63